MSPDNEYLDRMHRDLVERGRLIEAGWAQMRGRSIPLNAPPQQIEAMRTAYFMGAHHLYALIKETPETEEHRIEAIANELQEFMRDFMLRYIPPEGMG